MDREDHVAVRELGRVVVDVPEVDGNHSGVPVVAVDNVRREVVHMLHRLHDRAAKERKSLAVVEVPVAARPLEIVLVVDKVERNPVEVEVLKSAVLVPPAHRHAEARQLAHLVREVLLDVAVFRHDYTHVDALGFKGFRKRVSHVGKSACLRKRLRLGGNK